MAFHFVKVRVSMRQITLNSAVDIQLKENQLCCSKYPL